jgi:hypothetical protein
VVWEDGGGNPASYPILEALINDFQMVVNTVKIAFKTEILVVNDHSREYS